MPYFSYRVAKGDGKIIEERVESENEEALRRDLEQMDYLILSIKRLDGFSRHLYFTSLLNKRISPDQLIVFNQELIALVKAGIPIVKSLDLLIERTENLLFQRALRSVRNDIKGGASISDALAKHPVFFPELYVASLRAGEKSGNLVEILKRYISYLKEISAVRKKVITALSYPSFLLVVAMGVVFFLLIYVMPTFSEIYMEASSEVPASTLFLIKGVQFVRSNLLLIIGLIILILITLRYWYKTVNGRELFDRLILKTPLLGDIISNHNIVRIARTLSTVLSGGIPLVAAMNIVSEAITNKSISKTLKIVTESIKEGIGIGQAFNRIDLMPRMSIEMIEVGEATGSLEDMLNDVADLHENELDIKLDRITTWIEPVLLLIMGTIVGAIVVIMYLPIFNLAGTIR